MSFCFSSSSFITTRFYFVVSPKYAFSVIISISYASNYLVIFSSSIYSQNHLESLQTLFEQFPKHLNLASAFAACHPRPEIHFSPSLSFLFSSPLSPFYSTSLFPFINLRESIDLRFQFGRRSLSAFPNRILLGRLCIIRHAALCDVNQR